MRLGSLKTPQQEVYYRKAARLYEQGVTIPLILMGGIRSYGVAKKLVRDGKADYISMSRPLICEPGLVKRWREDTAEKRNVFQTMHVLHLHWTVEAFTA